MVNDQKAKELGGWLVLVGIGLVVAPLRLMLEYIPLYKDMFENGMLISIMSAGSDVFSPMLAVLIIVEMAFNVCMLVASVFLLFLFFKKHHLFPKAFAVVALISIVFLPLDAWFASKLMPDVDVLDDKTMKDMARVFVASIVWVPYMFVSKRVKETFVKQA